MADTTCDGKKKMFELLGKIKPVYVLELPQRQNEEATVYWQKQLSLYKEKLEEALQVTITQEAIWQAIDLVERFRKALKRVLDLAKRKPSPLTGMELLEICFRASFMPVYEERIQELEAIAQEIDQNPSPKQSKAPRILVTGVPAGMGSHKVIAILEECGASVVCIDNCTCYKKVREYKKKCDNAIEFLAQNTLDIPCAVMSPNPGRYESLQKLANEFSVDAVCDLTWQGCQTYDVESSSVRTFVHETLKLPFLQIVTDYAESDCEQLRIRIQAFLEMLA